MSNNEEKRFFVLRGLPHPSRSMAANACMSMPDGYVCKIEPDTRSGPQNRLFHQLCCDIAKQKEFAGKLRKPAQWKILLISGHAVATKHGSEMVPGLEGEFCNLRESTAKMSVKRMASLIEYALCYCAMNEIILTEPKIEPPDNYR